MPKPLLELENVNVKYGEVQVIWDLDLTVEEGEMVGLIGANGAGKTTLLKTISGIIHPASGSIYFRGEEISDKEPHEVYQMGLAQCPERRELFPQMSVRENLQMGAYYRKEEEDISETMEMVFDLFPRLGERTSQKAGSLSGGEGRMLSIGRSLMADPELLLLDEPSLGLQPTLVTTVFERIEDIHEMGVTILLNEQNVLEALETTDRGYVLEHGRISMEEDSEELIKDERIREKYLGL